MSRQLFTLFDSIRFNYAISFGKQSLLYQSSLSSVKYPCEVRIDNTAHSVSLVILLYPSIRERSIATKQRIRQLHRYHASITAPDCFRNTVLYYPRHPTRTGDTSTRIDTNTDIQALSICLTLTLRVGFSSADPRWRVPVPPATVQGMLSVPRTGDAGHFSVIG